MKNDIIKLSRGEITLSQLIQQFVSADIKDIVRIFGENDVLIPRSIRMKVFKSYIDEKIRDKEFFSKFSESLKYKLMWYSDFTEYQLEELFALLKNELKYDDFLSQFWYDVLVARVPLKISNKVIEEVISDKTNKTYNVNVIKFNVVLSRIMADKKGDLDGKSYFEFKSVLNDSASMTTIKNVARKYNVEIPSVYNKQDAINFIVDYSSPKELDMKVFTDYVVFKEELLKLKDLEKVEENTIASSTTDFDKLLEIAPLEDPDEEQFTGEGASLYFEDADDSAFDVNVSSSNIEFEEMMEKPVEKTENDKKIDTLLEVVEQEGLDDINDINASFDESFDAVDTFEADDKLDKIKNELNDRENELEDIVNNVDIDDVPVPIEFLKEKQVGARDEEGIAEEVNNSKFLYQKVEKNIDQAPILDEDDLTMDLFGEETEIDDLDSIEVDLDIDIDEPEVEYFEDKINKDAFQETNGAFFEEVISGSEDFVDIINESVTDDEVLKQFNSVNENTVEADDEEMPDFEEEFGDLNESDMDEELTDEMPDFEDEFGIDNISNEDEVSNISDEYHLHDIDEPTNAEVISKLPIDTHQEVDIIEPDELSLDDIDDGEFEELEIFSDEEELEEEPKKKNKKKRKKNKDEIEEKVEIDLDEFSNLTEESTKEIIENKDIVSTNTFYTQNYFKIQDDDEGYSLVDDDELTKKVAASEKTVLGKPKSIEPLFNIPDPDIEIFGENLIIDDTKFDTQGTLGVVKDGMDDIVEFSTPNSDVESDFDYNQPIQDYKKFTKEVEEGDELLEEIVVSTYKDLNVSEIKSTHLDLGINAPEENLELIEQDKIAYEEENSPKARKKRKRERKKQLLEEKRNKKAQKKKKRKKGQEEVEFDPNDLLEFESSPEEKQAILNAFNASAEKFREDVEKDKENSRLANEENLIIKQEHFLKYSIVDKEIERDLLKVYDANLINHLKSVERDELHKLYISNLLSRDEIEIAIKLSLLNPDIVDEVELLKEEEQKERKERFSNKYGGYTKKEYKRIQKRLKKEIKLNQSKFYRLFVVLFKISAIYLVLGAITKFLITPIIGTNKVLDNIFVLANMLFELIL